MLTVFLKDSMRSGRYGAYANAKSGDVVLLSPACASWDQYKCFEDRGTEFKRIVKELKEK